MILDLKGIVKKYNLNINGVIHCGGHYGEEYDTYLELGINNQVWFEPQPEVFKIMESKLPNNENIKLINKALGNDAKKVTMYVDSYNQGSSSILKPKLHLDQYRHIRFENEVEVDLVRLDDVIIEKDKYNFLYMDCQGYEYEILKGASNLLNNIDVIMTEVNRAEVYENCGMINELDDYLNQYQFNRVETSWAGGTWGDAFYIKSK